MIAFNKKQMATFAIFIMSTIQAFSANNVVFQKKAVRLSTDQFVIIGAGVTGLTSARTLLKAGVPADHITLIEKNGASGGKVNSVVVEGRPYELGAQMIIPGAYHEIENLRDEFGLKTIPLQRGFLFNIGQKTIGGIDSAKTGGVITAAEVPELGLQIGRYLKSYSELWHQEKNPKSPYRLLDPDGLTKVHPQLDKSWYEFVTENHFELLEKVFITILGGSGNEYNEFNPRHAARIVRALRPDLIKSILIDRKPVEIFEGAGFQGLWMAVAEKLIASGVTIKYDHQLQKITPNRAGGKLDLQVLSNAETSILSADQVIYTADTKYLPEVVNKSYQFGYDVFKTVIHSDYRSFLVKITGIPSIASISGSSGIIPHITGEITEEGLSEFKIGVPVLMVKPYADTDIVVIYAHGSAQIKNAQIENEIISSFSKIGGQAQILQNRQWPYRPKFQGDETKKIKKAMELQGRGGIWFMGEIFSFGAVHETFENAQAFTDLLLKNKL